MATHFPAAILIFTLCGHCNGHFNRSSTDLDDLTMMQIKLKGTRNDIVSSLQAFQDREAGFEVYKESAVCETANRLNNKWTEDLPGSGGGNEARNCAQACASLTGCEFFSWFHVPQSSTGRHWCNLYKTCTSPSSQSSANSYRITSPSSQSSAQDFKLYKQDTRCGNDNRIDAKWTEDLPGSGGGNEASNCAKACKSATGCQFFTWWTTDQPSTKRHWCNLYKTCNAASFQDQANTYSIQEGATPTSTQTQGYYTMPKGSCCCPKPIATKSECERAIDSLGLTRNRPWANNYGGIPGGCSFSDGNNDMHFNSASPGSKRSDMTPICIQDAPTPAPTRAPTPAPTTPPPPVPGAIQGESIPFPNIHLATKGYHLYEGDPLPVLPPSEPLVPYMTKQDPGLKKPVFAIAYTKKRVTADKRHTLPDGYHATVDYGCSTVFTTKTIRDEYEYTTDQSSKVTAYARAEAAIKFPPSPPMKALGKTGVSAGVSAEVFARVGGSMSMQFKEMRKSNSFRDSQMYRTEAKCTSYVAALSFAFPPETHPVFKAAVQGLGAGVDKYYALFDEFGTHFLTTIKMGARYGTTAFVDKAKASEMEKTAHGLGLGVQASMGARAKLNLGFKGEDAALPVVSQSVKANIPLLTPKEKIAAQEMQAKYVSKSTVSVVGPPLPQEGAGLWHVQVMDTPVPYSFNHEVICEHPEIASLESTYTKCVNAMNSYCEGHLKKRGATCTPAAEKGCYNDLDCEDDYVCRNWDCVPIPTCQVTIFSNRYYDGSSYTFPTVTAVKNFAGKKFSLKQADWADKISSFKMSEGCLKVKLYDDADWTEGRNDREWSYSQGYQLGSFGDDLDNDVVDMKIWAKPLPAETSALTEIGSNFSQQKRRRRKKQTKTKKAKKAGGAEEGSSKSLPDETEASEVSFDDPMDFMKNIGKALYGYNSYYGMPFSSNSAGTDPGFQHRPLWKASYDQGNPVILKEYDSIPRPAHEDDVDDVLTKCCKIGNKYAVKPFESWGSAPKSEQNIWEEHSCNEVVGGRNSPSCKGVDTSGEASNWEFVGNAYCKPYGNGLGSGEKYLGKDGCKSECDKIKGCNGVTYDTHNGHCVFRSQPTKPTSCDGNTKGWTYWKPSQVTHASGPHYVERTSGYCTDTAGCSYITEDWADCVTASMNLGWHNGRGGPYSSSSELKGCFRQDNGALRMNTRGSSWRSCSWSLKCACKCEASFLQSNQSSSKVVYGPSRNLQELALLKAPDGWTVTRATNTICDKDFTNKEIKSRYAYEHEAKNSFGIGKPNEMQGFTMSWESKEFRKANSKSKKAQYITTAECFEYMAEITDLEGNPPPTSSNFQYIVDSIEEPAHWYKMFDLYGQQFPDKVFFGAKYGFTQNIEESSWSTLSGNSRGFNVGAEVTKGIKKKKGMPDAVAFSASVGVSYDQKSSEQQLETFESFFSDQREYSLGRRMPDGGGGANEWVQQVDGEAMPFRYSFKSICDHPALASKKRDCEKYSESYCTEYLVKADDEVICDPADKPQCLWDIDCPKYFQCSEGKCTSEPACYVRIYDGQYQSGHNRHYGPVYYSETPDREPFSVGGKAKSAYISGGCAEVIFMDEDKCRITYSDNEVVTNRVDNKAKTVNAFNYDLENDICKVKLTAKQKWAGGKM